MSRAVGVAAVLAVAIAPAQAGWRPLELMLIDAGPGDAASKRCVDRIAAYFKAQGEDVALVRRPLAAIEATLPSPLPPSLLAWTDATTEPLRARRGDDPLDAIVAIDCRPAATTLDVVVNPAWPGVTTLRVRGVPIDDRAVTWIASRIDRAASIGFEP